MKIRQLVLMNSIHSTDHCKGQIFLDSLVGRDIAGANQQLYLKLSITYKSHQSYAALGIQSLLKERRVQAVWSAI